MVFKLTKGNKVFYEKKTFFLQVEDEPKMFSKTELRIKKGRMEIISLSLAQSLVHSCNLVLVLPVFSSNYEHTEEDEEARQASA